MSLKGVLLQIWRGPWNEFVAKNPLLEGMDRLGEASDGTTKMERREGVDNDAFREAVERGELIGIVAWFAATR